MSFPKGPPAIAIVPLGTGNDLSRSLNWGGKYRDKPLRKVLLDIANADVTYMDRWTLRVNAHQMQDDSEVLGGQDKLVCFIQPLGSNIFNEFAVIAHQCIKQLFFGGH